MTLRKRSRQHNRLQSAFSEQSSTILSSKSTLYTGSVAIPLFALALMMVANWSTLDCHSDAGKNHTNYSNNVEGRLALKLDDFRPIQYLGHGTINFVVLATIPNETLAKELNLWDESRNTSSQVVIKYVNVKILDGIWALEAEVFEQLQKVDKAKARQAGLVQAIWTDRDIDNPFYCDKHPCGKHNIQLPPEFLDRLGKVPVVDVVVLPYFKEKYILAIYDQNIKNVKIFLSSLMEQLALAHSVGISCNDAQVSRNVFSHADTKRAIVIDWNAHLPLGGYASDPLQSWQVAAPESWLQDAFGIKARTTSIHAIDVWQVGIMFVNILYADCNWVSASVLTEGTSLEKKAFLVQLINFSEGNYNNSVIAINAKESIDLRELAGMPLDKPNETLAKNFIPLLDCRQPKSWYLDNPKVSDYDKNIAIELLKQMLLISPSDRPTMDELLHHPFFQYK